MDQSVRQAAQECCTAVGTIGPEALEYFKYVKLPQLPDSPQHDSNIDLEKVVHLNEVPSEIVESPSYVAAALKQRSMVSEIPVPKRSQSPKRNRPVQSPEVKSARRASPDKNFLFSSKLLQAVLKSGSIIECKKGFDELEFHSFLVVR